MADLVERRHADGRAGILEGGACYGCVFTGGAVDSLWTFARLKRLTRAGRGVRRAALSGLLLGWVALKCLGLTAVTLARFVGRTILALASGRAELRWSIEALLLDVGVSIWARQLFTLLVSADLYRGVPAIYVNFIDYDVFAHAFGPSDRLAFRALRRVDRSILQLARIVRRLPELGYDLYVLSDHGQAATRPFHRVAGGASLEAVVRLALGGEAPALRVIAAGPNAFVYFTDRPEPLPASEIEARYPRAMARLSQHPGIGLVLARGASGPECWYRGHRVALAWAARPRRARSLRRTPRPRRGGGGARDLMAMPSAGDIVLYGTGAPGGAVSFVDERGAHAGPSEEELHTFILHPPAARLPAEAPRPPPAALPAFPGVSRGDGGSGRRDGRPEAPGVRGALSPLRFSLRGYLAVLVTAILLPMALLAVWLTATIAGDQRAAQRGRMQDTARAARGRDRPRSPRRRPHPAGGGRLDPGSTTRTGTPCAGSCGGSRRGSATGWPSASTRRTARCVLDTETRPRPPRSPSPTASATSSTAGRR